MISYKKALFFISVGFIIGMIVSVILTYNLGAKPRTINVGGVEYELPTITSTITTRSLMPTKVPSTPTISDAPDPTIVVVNTSSSTGLHTCGESAFNGDLQTTAPLFLRPEGYLSGWISSDPATIILPDGTTKVFKTQFVLIVEDIASVQLENVQRQAGKANAWGCWYSADLVSFISEDAKVDFCKKKSGNNFAIYYIVKSDGFQEIGSTTTISCP